MLKFNKVISFAVYSPDVNTLCMSFLAIYAIYDLSEFVVLALPDFFLKVTELPGHWKHPDSHAKSISIFLCHEAC